MQPSAKKLVTPATLVVDVILVVAFFIFMFWVVASHVPSRDHRMILLWGAVCASCLTCLFWLALQMLRIVARAQREGPEA